MKQFNEYTIGIIGLGNMGGAIAGGLAATFPPEKICGFDNNSAKVALFESDGMTGYASEDELAKHCDIILVAVKPDVVSTVLEKIKPFVSDKLILSIAAGVTISSMESIVGASTEVIRIMPNTPALVRQAMTVLCPGSAASEHSVKIAEEIFSLVGRTIVLPEKYIDAVTGLSGSGPAYVFTIIQAMADAGVKLGIPRDKSVILAAQTLLGSAEMVLSSGEDPISLRGKVTSPGGTTIAAVHVLERAGFSGILMDAVEAAALKSEQLGKKK